MTSFQNMISSISKKTIAETQQQNIAQQQEILRGEEVARQFLLSHIQQNWPRRFPLMTVNEDFVLMENHPRHLQQFYQYYTHPEINRFILVDRPKQLLETKKDIIYNRRLYYRKSGVFWNVTCMKTGNLAGTMGIYCDRIPIEIWYDLHPNYWRQGIMSQAVKQVIRYVKNQWPALEEMDAIILKENSASDAMLKKLKFQWQETLVNNRKYRDTWYDVERYRLQLNNT